MDHTFKLKSKGSERNSGILVSDDYSVQLDQVEYGVCEAIPLHAVQFNPRELGIIQKYQDSTIIYNEIISSTKIMLTRDIENDKVSQLNKQTHFNQNKSCSLYVSNIQ